MTVVVAIFSASVWTIDASHVDALRRRFPDVRFLQASNPDELAELIVDADVAFSSVVRDASFARAKRLRWIHSSAAGVGGTLFPALVESDVVLTNSRGVQAAAMGEHILAFVLGWRRRLHTAGRRQVSGTWAQDELSAALDAPRLSDTRAVIVGMGSIGIEAARLLRAVGMSVDGVARQARDDVHAVSSLPDLLSDADVVIITAPHTAETDRLFDREMLARMKPGALLVNVGRGRIIDETALIEGLRQGRPGAAALDVFEREPLAPASPLWQMENVILTPHVSGFSARFWDDLVDLFASNLERWRRGEPLENVVDKRRGY